MLLIYKFEIFFGVLFTEYKNSIQDDGEMAYHNEEVLAEEHGRAGQHGEGEQVQATPVTGLSHRAVPEGHPRWAVVQHDCVYHVDVPASVMSVTVATRLV